MASELDLASGAYDSLPGQSKRAVQHPGHLASRSGETRRARNCPIAGHLAARHGTDRSNNALAHLRFSARLRGGHILVRAGKSRSWRSAARPNDLCSYAFAKGFDSLLLGVKHFEYSDELCDLKQVTNSLRKSCKLDRASSIMRSSVERHQRSQPTAIDIADTAEVQHHSLIFVNKLLQGIAQNCRFFAKHNTTIAIDNRDAVQGASIQLELHGPSSMISPGRHIRVSGAEAVRKGFHKGIWRCGHPRKIACK